MQTKITKKLVDQMQPGPTDMLVFDTLLKGFVLNAVRLLLLTGCRVGELLALRWADIDLEAGALYIRDAKAGARAHPIGAVAAAFLAEMDHTSPWLLLGIKDTKKPLAANTLGHAWSRIRARAELQDVRLHDLRHTVGTYAGQAGANAFLVRDKLGHKTLAMTGRYVSKDANPLRELSNKVEGRIMAALKAGQAEDTGQVVPMPTKRSGRSSAE
ncbi:phage integrase family protein [Nitrospirillum amazonense]|uniref:Phage integrase family protein n=1 Tax=Nitrospirillum amazonense TaxID=28077 RepID=A0A560F5L2_9PROT|nr:site-specific integrase [Nitrospirillum amazonense]TWB16917.1 phage integrase family protein [Nitrospirillum amazonense]